MVRLERSEFWASCKLLLGVKFGEALTNGPIRNRMRRFDPFIQPTQLQRDRGEDFGITATCPSIHSNGA